MYSTKTHDISVTVQPVYLDEQSSPEESYFVWAYNVKIENSGTDTVQLRSRYWKITDARGRVQEVRGAGVVGEQPLPTSSGFMVGTYQMVTEAGEQFDVAIPAFSLDSPHEARRVN